MNPRNFSMWQGLVFGLLLVVMVCSAAAQRKVWRQDSPLAIKDVVVDDRQVKVFERVTLEVDLQAVFHNPFDAEVIGQGGKQVFSYDDWFRRYAENGCNFARLWLSLEWNDLTLITKDSGFNGIDLQRAWHIDHVLELAEKYDIRLMLCFDAHGMQRFVCKDSIDIARNRRRFYQDPISQHEDRPAQRNFFFM